MREGEGRSSHRGKPRCYGVSGIGPSPDERSPGEFRRKGSIEPSLDEEASAKDLSCPVASSLRSMRKSPLRIDPTT